MKFKKLIAALIIFIYILPQNSSAKMTTPKAHGIAFSVGAFGIIASAIAGPIVETRTKIEGSGTCIFVIGTVISLIAAGILGSKLSSKAPYGQFCKEFKSVILEVNKNPILAEMFLAYSITDKRLIELIKEEYGDKIPITKAFIELKKNMSSIRNLRKMLILAKQDVGYTIFLDLDEQELSKLYKIIQEKIEVIKNSAELKSEQEQVKIIRTFKND